MTKCVVLFSGGVDSLAALVKARLRYGSENVLAVYCDVGQRYAVKEINAVMDICEFLHQKFIVDDRLRLGEFEDPKDPNAIIPYRNTFFILIGALHLPPEGGVVAIQNVIKGESSTWDRRWVFDQQIQSLLDVADPKRVKLWVPHKDWTKGEIVAWLRDRVPDEVILKTVGCYSTEMGNCGQCKSCFRRWIALEWAGIENAWQYFINDPRKWTEGIKAYVRKMLIGYYHPMRVQQTFSVLQKYDLIPCMKRYVFDLDGVIAFTKQELQKSWELARQNRIEELQNLYRNATPNEEMIKTVNKLHELGHAIIIYTARHEEDRELTEEWLKKHGVKYDKIVFGKPHGDIYVDDLAVRPEEMLTWKV